MPRHSRPLRGIAMCHSAQWRFLMLEIVKRMKRDYGAAVHLYVFQQQGMKFYASAVTSGTIDSVQICSLISDGAQAPLTRPIEQLRVKALENEERYGVTYNEIMMTDRHIGRGFSLLAPKFPRSLQSENTDYWRIVQKFNDDFAFWENEIRSKTIDLIVFPQKIASVVARKLNVPTRNLTRSRIGNLFHWSREGEFTEFPEVSERTPATPLPPKPIEVKTYDQYEVNKRATVAGFSYHNAILRAGLWTLKYMAQRGSGRTSGYRWYDTVKHYLGIPRQWRELQGLPLKSLEDMRDKPFLFFTLQEEPETSLSWQSPESLTQIAYLWQLARDLPAGFMLAVKEHVYGVGRRPPGFYKHLLDFKNVVILDPLLRGPDVIRASKAVATVSSTAGFEAAWMGKPVISFGLHNIYSFLDHVFIANQSASLAPLLHKVLVEGIDADKAEKDGRRFHQAFKDLSFEIGQDNMYKPEEFDPSNLATICRHLAVSVGLNPVAAEAGAVA
jgi:hypothetical protein